VVWRGNSLEYQGLEVSVGHFVSKGKEAENSMQQQNAALNGGV